MTIIPRNKHIHINIYNGKNRINMAYKYNSMVSIRMVLIQWPGYKVN